MDFDIYKVAMDDSLLICAEDPTRAVLLDFRTGNEVHGVPIVMPSHILMFRHFAPAQISIVYNFTQRHIMLFNYLADPEIKCSTIASYLIFGMQVFMVIV